MSRPHTPHVLAAMAPHACKYERESSTARQKALQSGPKSLQSCPNSNQILSMQCMRGRIPRYRSDFDTFSGTPPLLPAARMDQQVQQDPEASTDMAAARHSQGSDHSSVGFLFFHYHFSVHAYVCSTEAHQEQLSSSSSRRLPRRRRCGVLWNNFPNRSGI